MDGKNKKDIKKGYKVLIVLKKINAQEKELRVLLRIYSHILLFTLTE
ncbi:hypothetical protein [Methanobacterium petrolearium]